MQTEEICKILGEYFQLRKIDKSCKTAVSIACIMAYSYV